MESQPVGATLYSLETSPPRKEQRRTSERHLSLFRVGSLLIDGRRELCLIRNISAGGMLIRAYSQIAAGDRLAIELKQGEAVSGIARWTEGDCVGIGFDDPIDVVSLISAGPANKQPRMPRIEVNCAAWVREGATVHRVTALDVSQGGAKIATPTSLPVGANIVLTLNALVPVEGVIRWQQEDAYGIAFNRPLGLPILVGWLQDLQRRQAQRAVG